MGGTQGIGDLVGTLVGLPPTGLHPDSCLAPAAPSTTINSRSLSHRARVCRFHLFATRACFSPIPPAFVTDAISGRLLRGASPRLRSVSVLRLTPRARGTPCSVGSVRQVMSKPLILIVAALSAPFWLILYFKPGGTGGSRAWSFRCVGEKLRTSARGLTAGAVIVVSEAAPGTWRDGMAEGNVGMGERRWKCGTAGSTS